MGELVPPRYCSARCKKREGNRRNRQSQHDRVQNGGEIGTQIEVQIMRCARPRCGRSGVRQWNPATTSRPIYCSPYCARRASADERRALRTTESLAACKHPEKLSYSMSPAGVRKAAIAAVRYERYVYASCGCYRLHLTSQEIPGVPRTATDPRLPFIARTAAWHDYLRPIARQVRERKGQKVRESRMVNR